MGKETVQRARHPGEIQGFDEQARVSDLPAAAAAHEASKLFLGGPSFPRGLLLEGAEGSQFSLTVDDPFHGSGTERADQLILQISDAHVEADSFHVGSSEVRAQAGPLETTAEVALLRGVTEARQPEAEPLRAVQIQETSDVRRSPDRHDGDPLNIKVATTALGQRFDRALVADPLDEHDRPCDEPLSRRRWLQLSSMRTVSTIFPGFMMPLGSRAVLMAAIVATASACSSRRNPTLP
jgi:hypothetical protein